MEWLKAILEKAVITDGQLDIDGVVKQVNAEFPKHAVPKEDYNSKVKELNTANDTIKSLKDQNGDNEELQKQIETYKTTVKDLQKASDDFKKEVMLKELITKAGCTDPEYLIYKHGGIDKFTFDKDGKPVGVDETMKSYKDSMSHLFKTDPITDYSPSGGSTPSVKNPWAKDSFNLSEQGRMFKENPVQARQLAAAAGTTLEQ